jgi:chemotaxis response regulator CheB
VKEGTKIIVISDFNMPNMNGVELYLKIPPETRKVIIFILQSGNPKGMEEALKANNLTDKTIFVDKKNYPDAIKNFKPQKKIIALVKTDAASFLPKFLALLREEYFEALVPN